MNDAADCNGGLASLMRKQEQVRERLQRLCLAYARSQEAIADAFDRMTTTECGTDAAQSYPLHASHCRTAASAAMIFLEVLDRPPVQHQER